MTNQQKQFIEQIERCDNLEELGKIKDRLFSDYKEDHIENTDPYAIAVAAAIKKRKLELNT